MQGPPVHAETHTSFGSTITLNNRPDMPKHSACALFVVADVADVLAFVDGGGKANVITFPTAFNGTIRGTFNAITGTTTTVVSVTAFYMSDPG